MKKVFLFFYFCTVFYIVSAQNGDRFDWMNDPDDPVMQMFRETQRRAQQNSDNSRPSSDLDPPPMWGGTLIEGMFVLYSKNDTREDVLLRNNNRVQFTRVNLGNSIVDRFVDGDKRADFQFGGRGGVISSVEMVFGNRTLEEYTRIINSTKNIYGSALTVIYENSYRFAGDNVGTIGVADAKFNVWGIRGWTIEIEFVSRTIPMAGEYSREIRIREKRNIVIE